MPMTGEPHRGSMARVGLLISGLGLLLLLGVVALLAHGLLRIAEEESLRHQMVAERLFDELERELTDLTLREEARSFLQYRYFYVPETQLPGLAGLARSPLSEPSDDPAVLGWFQIEPDGTLYTPYRPRPGEQQLAADNYGQEVDPTVLAVEARLMALLAQVEWAGEGPAATAATAVAQQAAEQQAQQVAAAPQQGKAESLYNTLNRAVTGRQRRDVQSYNTQQQAIDPFRRNEEDIQQVVESNLWSQGERYRDNQLPGDERNTQAKTAEGEVGVQIAPLEGMRLDADHLLLHRTVTIGQETWRQGLVLLLPALEHKLGELVLGASALEPWVGLDWGVRSAPPRHHAFSHAFAAPFQDLTLTAQLGRIPGQTPAGSGMIIGLTALLLALCAAGGLALYRTVAARMELAQRRSDFVAAVSHELKTPLTAIRMMGEILRDGMVPSEDRRQQYYETITAESERLSRLIGNVLELARLERGGGKVERVVGPVGEVLEQVLEVLGPHARQKGFTLELMLAPDLPAVSMDRDALLQVLLNLVDNALKFAVLADDKRIVLQARAHGAEVVLAVRDHGPGVPSRQLHRIFQPFYRGERELTRRTKGTGIGLALVAGLVQRMGGRVEALNHPEGGLEVRVVLAQA